MFHFKRLVLVGALVVAAAACGDDTQAESESAATAAAEATDAPEPEVTAAEPAATVADQAAPLETSVGEAISVVASNGTVTVGSTPTKIISLSPAHTEILFAIGAGDQVVAVDDQSNYPPEAEAVKSDLSGFTPNIEAIAGYKPDLVVMADDYEGLTAQLNALDIPVWSGNAPATLDDAYAQIEQLGVLTGHAAEAVQVSSGMQADIEVIVVGLPKLETPLTYYHELDPTYFSSTSRTFIGAVYALAGLTNIADAAEAGNDYPQLNTEYIITANPDLIFLADSKCCGETPETVAARDGWGKLTAVKNGNVIPMDDDLASRWGPRIVDYLQAVSDAVTAAAAVPAG